MFKTSHLILLGLVLVVLYFTIVREHLANKDNSKNWDRPERSSLPLGTPQEQETQQLKSRIDVLEAAVTELKSKVH
jgi:cell division protein FtsB